MAARCFYQTGEDVEYIERFKVMLLNRANRVKGIITIGMGGITACAVDTKVILQACKFQDISLLLTKDFYKT